MNIGIFGGTFNPIHNGHLLIAQYAIERCSLDKVLFMTSAMPPHKDEEDVTPPEVRHRLVSLATEGYEDFYPFDYELKRDGPSYTANTLCSLKEEYRGNRLFFIMGADSLRDFGLWREPERIASYCTLIVYPRHGVDIWAAAEAAREKYGADIKILNAPIMEISSTDIRSRVKHGLPVDFFLPESVLSQMKKEKLYV